MASKIILKKSSVAAKAPVAGDLEFGELAINYTDSKLYFKKADGSIDAFTSAAASAPVTSVGGNIGAVTDAQLLASIKNVDGTGSGLDADFLDGLNASAFYLASNPNGYTSNTGTVTSVGATAPLVSSGGTAPSISIPAANSTTNGYMSSAYAAKLDGIAAGATNVTNNNQLTNGAGYITSAALASYLPLTGGSLTGPLNVNRRRLSFSSSYNDANHSIYNNYENIDGEGIWDGMKMNVYEGLRVRVGNASGVTPTTILALSSSSVRINTQLQVGQNTNGTATIDAYNGFAWFGRDSNTTGIRIDGSGNVHTTAALNSVGALTQNGNQVLHAGNYTSYSMPSGSSATNSVDVRAPIFYDSNDTGYYIDPSSYSRIRQLTLTQARVDSSKYPVGHYAPGEEVFAIDPTWTQDQLREYFNSNNVSWVADSTAPGGYAIQLTGAINVGGVYGSGFPYIPVETDDTFYMEVYIKNVTGSNTHYMGSMDFNHNFTNLGGNPGSFGYWVMSNNNPGTGWTKYSGYISGFGTATGQFVSGTEYWTPQALFNYSGGGTSYISGWKVLKLTKGIVGRFPNSTVNTGEAWYGRANDRNRGTYTIQLGGNSASGRQFEVVDYAWSTVMFRVDSANFSESAGSSRAPIFYDSNDTGYYIDPNSTSTSYRGRGEIFLGPNTSSQYLRLGGNGGAVDHSTVSTSNGNLHIDAKSGNNLYLAWYNGSDVMVGGGIQATIYYDRNDTSYYIDAHSTSYQRSLFLGAHDSGTSEFRFGEDSSGWYGDRWYWDSSYTLFRYSRFAGTDSLIHYHDTRDASRITYGRNIVFDNYGKGIVGTYASTRYQAVFAMGDSYKLPVDGTTTGSLYGLAWSHPNAGGTAGNLNTHGLLVLENGGFLAAVSGSIRSRDDMRTPIFYDSNNTGYYVNPDGTSNLNAVVSYSYQGNGNVGGTGSAAWFPSGLYTGSGATNWMYGHIYRAGYDTYGGGRVDGSIFYDTNNTGYYADLSSTGTSINAAGSIIAGGNVTAYSDENLKTDWSNLPVDYVEQLSKLLSGTFTRKDTNERQAGVGAQSLQKFLPEVVIKGVHLSVAYGNAAMVSAVELAKRVVEQDARIAKLEERLSKLLDD